MLGDEGAVVVVMMGRVFTCEVDFTACLPAGVHGWIHGESLDTDVGLISSTHSRSHLEGLMPRTKCRTCRKRHRFKPFTPMSNSYNLAIMGPLFFH